MSVKSGEEPLLPLVSHQLCLFSCQSLSLHGAALRSCRPTLSYVHGLRTTAVRCLSARGAALPHLLHRNSHPLRHTHFNGTFPGFLHGDLDTWLTNCSGCMAEQQMSNRQHGSLACVGRFELGQAPTTKEAQAIADALYSEFVGEDVDKVELVYTKFVSLISSDPIIQTLLPLTPQVNPPPSPVTFHRHALHEVLSSLPAVRQDISTSL